jgi:hypothetical protein
VRSMLEIVNLVVDGKITTKEQAAALVDEEVAEGVKAYKITEAQARKNLLASIGYVTGYLDHKQGDVIMELFDTEHPIFGRTHPSAEEAYAMGKQYAEKRKEERG